MTARRDSQVQSTERVPAERARAHWIGGYNINGGNTDFSVATETQYIRAVCDRFVVDESTLCDRGTTPAVGVLAAGVSAEEPLRAQAAKSQKNLSVLRPQCLSRRPF